VFQRDVKSTDLAQYAKTNGLQTAMKPTPHIQNFFSFVIYHSSNTMTMCVGGEGGMHPPNRKIFLLIGFGWGGRA
jgi:hypothetical protein